MPPQDVRWIQRYNHFRKALAQLQAAITLSQQRPLSPLEEQGLIQAFEFTHETAWNTVKEFLEGRGVKNIYGSRDVTRQACQTGLIKNGETWMKIMEIRNLTTHTYNEEIARKIATAIIQTYFVEFISLQAQMEKLTEEQA